MQGKIKDAKWLLIFFSTGPSDFAKIVKHVDMEQGSQVIQKDVMFLATRHDLTFFWDPATGKLHKSRKRKGRGSQGLAK
jgi:hypothetical protein